MERTFIAIKPDGVQRGLVGDIIKRFEQKGFRLVAMKFLTVRAPFSPPQERGRVGFSVLVCPRLLRSDPSFANFVPCGNSFALCPVPSDPPPTLARARQPTRPWEG